MESYLINKHYDLVSPDGYIESIDPIVDTTRKVLLKIENISEAFLGFSIDPSLVVFNLKSTLAQLGIDATLSHYELNKKHLLAKVYLTLKALSPIGKAFLHRLTTGAYIGKLFASDDRRKVREPYYLKRMFGRKDKYGNPLLCFGSENVEKDFELKKIDGYTIAFIPVVPGQINYDKEIYSLLPSLEKMLHYNRFSTREILKLNQFLDISTPPIAQKGKILLIQTAPLHIRTVFGCVMNKYLPSGVYHTSANILEPETTASGDIYEFYGQNTDPITHIPLEFYTLEPHREYVFFSDRDQLKAKLENTISIFQAFETAPKSKDLEAAVYIMKSDQMTNLSQEQWITRKVIKFELPGMNDPEKQNYLISQYLRQLPSYPFLKAIEKGLITSQGLLFLKYFPSPFLKRFLLENSVQSCLKGIYFTSPSRSGGDYFSVEDRAFLLDLARFALPVYWVDKTSNQILQYVIKPHREAGMFVPIHLIERFQQATTFGVYGSNLIEGNFEKELEELLSGILSMQKTVHHPLLHKDTPLALVTGGGPGAMELGNRVAKKLNILSCANIVDFRQKDQSVVNEQHQNPHIEAKMTYRLDQLVERQAEFHLDFPIFLMGGIGMDFEYTLEEVRRKVGASPPYPIMLFGDPSYWKKKITSRFQCNLKTGTIKGSEWVSNCFYCIKTAKQGLKIYHQFFTNKLEIGKNGPVNDDGFITVN